MSGLTLAGIPLDITRMMQDTAFVGKRQLPVAGKGTGYAKPIYGPLLAYQCRISRRTQMVRGDTGELKVSSAQVWFATQLDINPDDKIVLGEDADPTPILRIDRSPGEYGDYLQKIYL